MDKPPSKRDTPPVVIHRKKSATSSYERDSVSSLRMKTVSVRKTRGKTVAQQRWLVRQLNDPYVQAAQKQGWRSRAAFKLLELDERYHLIKSGARVVDLGAAPGGWSQVALRKGASKVVGIDLLPIEPMEGVSFIQGDFTDPEMPDILKTHLSGKADVVLSDMAPNTTGHAATDHLRIIGLAEMALVFAAQVLADNGSFVAKVFQGGTEGRMLESMKKAFQQVRHAKPPASRKESSELYVMATGFRSDRKDILLAHQSRV